MPTAPSTVSVKLRTGDAQHALNVAAALRFLYPRATSVRVDVDPALGEGTRYVVKADGLGIYESDNAARLSYDVADILAAEEAAAPSPLSP